MDEQNTVQGGDTGVGSQEPAQGGASQEGAAQATSTQQAATQQTPSPYGGGSLYGGGQQQQTQQVQQTQQATQLTPQQIQQIQAQQAQQQQTQQSNQGGIPEQYMQQPSPINIPAVLGYIHEQQGKTGETVQQLQETLKAMQEESQRTALNNYRTDMVNRWDSGIKEMKGKYDPETAGILETKLGEYLEDENSIIHRAVKREPEALQELLEAYVLKNEIDPQKMAQNVNAVAQMQQGMLNQLNSTQPLGGIPPQTKQEESLWDWEDGEPHLTKDSFDE